MKTKLDKFWEYLRQCLWFIPAICIGAAILLSVVMVYVDEVIVRGWEGESPFIYRSDPDASLAILSTITSSLITVAGVTFSITVVALTLASSQFGPRLLRNFLRSFSSQITFGFLMGSFVYGICLMPNIGSDWAAGDPHPSISLMIVLAVICVGLLIYYIHHVATSIQADTQIALVFRELEMRIDELEDLEDRGDVISLGVEGDARIQVTPIRAWCSGYLNAFDKEGLSDWAKRNDCSLSFSDRAGQFIAKGCTFGEVRCRAATFDSKRTKDLEKYIFVDEKRSPEQDLEFLIDQLVEMALRALSPSINDPHTAIRCIDYLSAALVQLGIKRLPASRYFDSDGIERVYIPQTDYEGVVNDSFDQIRQQAADHPSVIIRLLEALGLLRNSMGADQSARLRVIDQQIDQVSQLIDSNSFASKDLSDMKESLSQSRARKPDADSSVVPCNC